MRKIFHLQLKEDNSHRYYGSLSAVFSDGLNLGISKSTLDRHDFKTNYYENKICIIRKSVLKTRSEVIKKPKPQI
jgi:hypothetical protein